MTAAAEHHYLLPASVPSALIAVAALAGCAGWAMTHLLPRPGRRWARTALAAGRAGVAFGALLLGGQVLQRGVLLATNWPVWTIALAMALSVEVVLGLYALERRTVSRRTGIALGALRAVLVLLVLGVLAQPVRSLEWSQKTPRYVAVLVDHSASMHVIDSQMTPWEKLRLAEALGCTAARRPYRMEALAAELAGLRGRLSEQAEWLDVLAGANLEARRRGLRERQPAIRQAAADAAERISQQLARLLPPEAGGMKLDASLQAGLSDVRTRLAGRAREPLLEVARLTAPDAGTDAAALHGNLLSGLRRAIATLVELGPRIEELGRSLDDARYAGLDEQDRQKIDSAVRLSRLGLSQALLNSPGPRPAEAEPSAPLLHRLQERYVVKGYLFGATAVETDPARWTQDAFQPPATPPAGIASSAPATGPATASLPASAPAEALGGPDQQTNLAAALQKVLSDLPADRIAGVLVLTDGRHNALAQPVEPVAQRLGALGVPVCCVQMGSTRPPVDAAVVSLDVPDTVYVKDRMYLTAELKLDGLAGRDVAVTLHDEAGKAVDGNVIRVPADTYRTRLQLSHTPEQAGVRQYRLAIEGLPQECFGSNNEQAFTVAVTDDQVRLLLIEDRPRWEFRYVKNLFAGRDRTVHLQYVLLSPDRVPDVPQRGRIVASAAAPAGQTEATALPDQTAEWMKFDVILLGDVPPQALSPGQQEDLRQFVVDRGGTLIVVCGPTSMPLAYRGTPLAEILPATWDPPGAEPSSRPAGPFRITLTPEGGEHVVMRLGVDPDQNQGIWESFPLVHWRLTGLRPKPAAAVLAYARDPAAPPPADEDPKDDPAGQAARPSTGSGRPELAERRKQQRGNALITEQPVGMGQVMMLSFDQTWRLRYRVGDTYHHKFWGQLLRWATAGKLPSGTSLVKMGTDRARYWPGQRVRVRAKILAPDLSPVRTQEVAVRILRDEQLVDRKRMDYRPDSPGIYEAELGPLPAGTYQAELDAPAARDILASENATTVRTDFAVSAATPVEQIELSADRDLLTAVADLTGGVVVDAPQAALAIGAFGPGVLVRPQRSQYVIWNHWPLLGFILMVAAAEWLLRKKAGLA